MQCTRLEPVEGLGVGEDVLVFPNHLLAVPNEAYPLMFVTHGGLAPRLKVRGDRGGVTNPEPTPGATFGSVYTSPDGIPSHKFKIRAVSSESGAPLPGAAVRADDPAVAREVLQPVRVLEQLAARAVDDDLDAALGAEALQLQLTVAEQRIDQAA